MPEPSAPEALVDCILTLLADGTPRSTGELAAALGVDRVGMSRTMMLLKHRGRVVSAGTVRSRPATGGGWERGKASQQTVWTLPDTRR